MSEPIAKIERAKNGFEVEMCDPKIKKENMEPEGPYRDPYVTYVFSDMASMMEFLQENLEKAVPMDDYETSFDEAAMEESNE